ncbi:E3 ubiquitin-protein ligase DZIP3 [Stylophora pistillata]|uniref:E3 ubiquitin-protein ligase DZIP3 n=1 Tax=Stylophora pistillata TaxID=50429 RepID=A0A2B4RQC0_STYPI|nr:E3 ubiquitin-protein ligase DZIP3 [Stylophora pistillata]
MIQAETKTDLLALWQMYLEVFAKSGDHVMLRTRRNSDSVVYIKPKENEVTVILSELKEAQIEFQKEKIESLEKQNASLRERLEELELMTDGPSELNPLSLQRVVDWECHSNVSLETGFWSQSKVSELEVEDLEGSHVEIPGSQPVFPTPLSRQTTNFALLCHLLLDVGTQVLGDTFDRIIPPERFQGVLMNHIATLQSLVRKRLITCSQLERLFPHSGTSVSSAQLDASTLFLLFRTICGMSCPATGWFLLPLATDISPEADLVRVRHYSNHVIGCAEHALVDDAKFQQLWSEIRKPLIRLGGPRYEDIIDALIIHNMDFDEREYNKEFSLQFVGEIDEVLKKVERTPRAMELTATSLKEEKNYARLCRLLVDIGSAVLRDSFDSWDTLPAALTDVSREADIARVRYYGNIVYAHAYCASVDDVTFNKYWRDIRDILVRLGGVKYKAAIDDLETERMDPEIECYYKELSQWKKDEASIADSGVGEIIQKLGDLVSSSFQ